jgi:hypothetical protein
MSALFPGMDPYLEAPHLWPDFHNAFASVMRGELNRTMPRPYYARLEMRPEVGIIGEESNGRAIVPDVSVVRVAGAAGQQAGAAVLELPRTNVSESLEVTVASEPIRHLFIEIRDPTEGHKLITLIEIVSPSNKRSGPDRRAYQRKQREVLESDASLIEIDLLRHGERLPANDQIAEIVANLDPLPHYLVYVYRPWARVGDVMGCQLFPFRVRDVLPCIPIPLRHEEAEVTLDLRVLFNRAYDDGPYRLGAVDYTRPPRQALDDKDAVWAEELLRGAGK